MKTKKYLITNNSEGSICVTGRTRIDIPGMCKDLPILLPENTARQTILRLKQRYPLLKIREAQENLSGNNPKVDLNADNATSSSSLAASNDKGNNSSEPDKNPINTETAPEKGQTASATADNKNSSQDSSSQNQAATQKPDNKKGK